MFCVIAVSCSLGQNYSVFQLQDAEGNLLKGLQRFCHKALLTQSFLYIEKGGKIWIPFPVCVRWEEDPCSSPVGQEHCPGVAFASYEPEVSTEFSRSQGLSVFIHLNISLTAIQSVLTKHVLAVRAVCLMISANKCYQVVMLWWIRYLLL